MDLLQSLPEVDGERIGAIGHSLGGHNAMFTAAFDERIKAVVSSCGFCSFAKYYGGNLTGWTSDRYMPRIATVYGKDPKKVPFDFTDVLIAIAPRAVLAVAPVKDDNFAVEGREGRDPGGEAGVREAEGRATNCRPATRTAGTTSRRRSGRRRTSSWTSG